MSDATVNAATDNTAPSVVQVEETPANRIFAGNLPLTVTEDEVRSFFESVQDQIKSIHVTVRDKTGVAFAFVDFIDEAAAKSALELDGHVLNGEKVKVQPAKSREEKDKERNERRARRRPGRRGSRAVPGVISEAEVNGDGAAAAPATDVAPKPRKKKRNYPRNRARGRRGSTATAEVNPAPPAEVDPVSAEDVPKKRPRRSKTRKFRFPRSFGGEPAGERTKTIVFVANIPFKFKDKHLKQYFRKEGYDVRDAKISGEFNREENRWRSNGFGFVDVRDEESQQKAIHEMSGKDFGGRVITVKAYDPKVATEEADIAEPPGSADDAAAAPAIVANAASAA